MTRCQSTSVDDRDDETPCRMSGLPVRMLLRRSKRELDMIDDRGNRIDNDAIVERVLAIGSIVIRREPVEGRE